MPGMSVMRRLAKFAPFGVMLFALSGCASQLPTAREVGAPGFFSGLFHGWIVMFSFIGSLFSDDIAIYSVPNNGGWYNFGFALGVGAFTGSAAASRR